MSDLGENWDKAIKKMYDDGKLDDFVAWFLTLKDDDLVDLVYLAELRN